LGLLTTGATSPGCHSGVPLVPMVFRTSLLERCAKKKKQREGVYEEERIKEEEGR
jgi:hypothetical protein